MEQPTNAVGSNGFTGDATAAGPTAGFDPVLISLIRRSMPNLVAYDICGVQPMSGPTGLIFAMRSRYENQGGEEALFNEADTGFSAGGDTNKGDYAVRAGDGTSASVTHYQMVTTHHFLTTHLLEPTRLLLECLGKT